MMNSVIRATLSEQVHAELRTRILRGELKSGHRLLPEELASNLSISQTPVKEALLCLEADGLVVSGLRKGAIVRLFTLKDVEELYEARILIELEALATAFARGTFTETVLAELEDNLERHGFHLRRDSLDDLTSALAFDRAFHHRFVLARDNAVIADWHMRILAQTHTANVYLANGTSHVYGEHRAILDTLRSGSLEQTQNALRNHLNRSRDSLVANVRESGSK